MPFTLFDKLKSEAGKAGRSVNAELVGRLERSLAESSNDLDVRIIFEALERLSLRNPDLRYSFGVNLDGQPGARPAELKNGSWTLAADPANGAPNLASGVAPDAASAQRADLPQKKAREA